MNIHSEIDGARPIAATAYAPALDYDDKLREDSDQDRNLDMLCEQWVSWCRTRRLYSPAPISGTVLGRLSGSSTRPMAAVDVFCSAEMAAFHIAYTCQPREALDRQVFEAYYVLRIKPIKRVADALGISRQHFYALLAAFRVRVWNAAEAIAADNQRAHQATLARRVAREELVQP
ncbi:MAG: hypothetical protein I8H71_00355 [Xanthomonadaceae bacterium]|nr:hypothetical protein [Xanthomonadaceae bacterium]MBH2008124.1 hypothetical protein [Xanthomonadaceae bacterium]